MRIDNEDRGSKLCVILRNAVTKNLRIPDTAKQTMGAKILRFTQDDTERYGLLGTPVLTGFPGCTAP